MANVSARSRPYLPGKPLKPDAHVRVWIAESALDAVHQEARRYAPDLESGGLLLGYWATALEAVITTVTLPGPLAIRRRNSYVPDGDHDQHSIERLFDESRAAITYLGDWHSHPRSSARLSAKDRQTLRRIAEEPDAVTPRPLMLVITGESHRWAAKAEVGQVAKFGPFAWLQTESVRLTPYEAEAAPNRLRSRSH